MLSWVPLLALAQISLVPGPADRRIIEFTGACDASGAVVLDARRFAVGDDEDNVVRIYDGITGGAPLVTRDISAPLRLPKGKKRYPEADIEAATGLGTLSWWLTSHGRTRSGKRATSRFLLFATRAHPNGHIELVGEPYAHLLEDLLDTPSLHPYRLAAAAERPPKEPGGLNIEGMTAMEDGASVLIGFRNPVPRQGALVIPLLNPKELLNGQRARFGEPALLDFGGRGVRSISRWRGRYLFIAGASSTGSDLTSQLYSWSGRVGEPPRLEPVDLTGLNPEAFVTWEDRDEFLLLSDDGTTLIEGQPCKRLKDPAKKRFRGVWVKLTPQRRPLAPGSPR